MTDAELRDAAVKELEATTVGYLNKHWTKPPAGTHWANALALLEQIGGSTPPPPPPSKGVVAFYDNDSNKATDWPAIQAVGGTHLLCGADDPASLAELQKTGGKAWAAVGYWNDATGTFSHTDAEALQIAQSAVKSYPGVIEGWYVADEPSMHANAPALVAARSKLLAGVLNVETLIAMWDTTIFASFKGSASAFALDGYPNLESFDMSVITKQASAADNLGIRYYGVLGAFTDGGAYKLPTPSQLQQMIDTWNGTKQVGISVYEWGPAGGPSSTWLQNQPSLLAVLKAAYA